MKIIILAGGAGTRLWPISRTNYPKQFIKLKNRSQTIFQMAFERSLKLVGINDIYIVTNEDYKFHVLGQIEELGYLYNERNILIEPKSRNTLPAIYYGVQEIRQYGEDVVAIFPSDHLMRDEQRFVDIVRRGEALTDRYLVTFGIYPSKPHTGYGYIKPKRPLSLGYKVAEFKEKPNLQMAKVYLDEGYLWNSGIFMFRTNLFVDEVRKYCSEVYQAFQSDNIGECFDETPDISIDYGLMEKSDRVAVIPLDIKWSDLGSFDAFYDEYPADELGNVKFQRDVLIDSYNNLVYSNNDKAVGLIGVKDLIIVDEKDALLVCRKDCSQKVKDVVNILKTEKDPRADNHMIVYRPWGSYTLLEEGNSYKIKRITVLPGKKLSYQFHFHRSEHWVVVKGTAQVTIEGQTILVRSGESIFVKSGLKHRLENPGKLVLEVLEIQLGEYLEEDDIIRFEDDFGRC